MSKTKEHSVTFVLSLKVAIIGAITSILAFVWAMVSQERLMLGIGMLIVFMAIMTIVVIKAMGTLTEKFSVGLGGEQTQEESKKGLTKEGATMGKAATFGEIKQILTKAKENPDNTHVIMVCDRFDNDDYPVYVTKDKNVREVEAEYSKKNMQEVMEVYNLSMDIDEQLSRPRCFQY